VAPIPDPLFLRLVAWNSDHYTKEAAYNFYYNFNIYSWLFNDTVEDSLEKLP
jgi:hypothetical protein